MQRVHVFISGNVQGVSFRATTQRKAREHGVNGWVKNLPDGRVEAVFEGESDDVRTMLRFVHDGPRLADVENIEAEEEEPQQLRGFRIRR